MQTGHPTCGTDSCLSAKELEADSVVYQCTPTPGAAYGRLALASCFVHDELVETCTGITHPRSSLSGKNATVEEPTKEGTVR